MFKLKPSRFRHTQCLKTCSSLRAWAAIARSARVVVALHHGGLDNLAVSRAYRVQHVSVQCLGSLLREKERSHLEVPLEGSRFFYLQDCQNSSKAREYHAVRRKWV